VVGLATVLGSGAMTNTIEEIAETGAILVIGSNPPANHPIIGYRIRKAVRKGAKLIVIDPRQIPFAQTADVHLQLKPGTDIALCNGLAHVIIKEGLADWEYIEKRTQGFQHLKKMVEKYTPEYVSELTGVPSEKIITAARLFAKADVGSIFYCMGVTQHTSGTENVLALTNLSLLTGNLGKLYGGMNPLRGQNNVQGACDMGCLPNVLPGYQPIHSDRDTGAYWQRIKEPCRPEHEQDATCDQPVDIITSIEFEQPIPSNASVSDYIRAKFSQAWNVELSDVPGRTIAEMFHFLPSRRNRVMYIVGENPAVSSPHVDIVREALEGMDFVVVQDIFLTETACYADVVLPATSFAEKDGTFINTERRVQRIRRAVTPRGESKADWEIFQELANKFGLNWNYSSPKEIWDEVRKLTPHYFGGMSYQRLEQEGLQWPCPTEDHPGTPVLHREKFSRGIGQFSTVEYRPLAAEATDKDYPFVLTTSRKLHHFHTRTMTGKSDGLNYFLNEELMEINPQDAAALKLADGESVKITSRRGSIRSKIQITDQVPPGLVSMSFHFAETPVNVITDPAVCNMSVVSGLKVAAVRIDKD
jgi:predicted molibdopterin-dependent oxidoreductase YjgC